MGVLRKALVAGVVAVGLVATVPSGLVFAQDQGGGAAAGTAKTCEQLQAERDAAAAQFQRDFSAQQQLEFQLADLERTIQDYKQSLVDRPRTGESLARALDILDRLSRRAESLKAAIARADAKTTAEFKTLNEIDAALARCAKATKPTGKAPATGGAGAGVGLGGTGTGAPAPKARSATNSEIGHGTGNGGAGGEGGTGGGGGDTGRSGNTGSGGGAAADTGTNASRGGAVCGAGGDQCNGGNAGNSGSVNRVRGGNSGNSGRTGTGGSGGEGGSGGSGGGA